MCSFRGVYGNRGNGTKHASSDVVRVRGLDLPCGAGRLGLQGAPGALPSALGFKSLPQMQKIPAPVGGRDLLARDKGFEPLRSLPLRALLRNFFSASLKKRFAF